VTSTNSCFRQGSCCRICVTAHWILFCMLHTIRDCAQGRMGSSTHTATYCDVLQRTEMHCTPWHQGASTEQDTQQTATLCNTPQHTATHRNTPQHTATHRNTPPHTATHRHMLHTLASKCKRKVGHATYCNALQHTATNCTHLHQSASAW